MTSDAVKIALEALRMSKDLLDVVEQTPGNVWHVAADDPETACCDTMSAVEKALAALEQAGEPVADWRSFKRGPYVVYDPDDETYLAVGGAWHLDLDDGDSFAIFEDAQRAVDDAGLGKVESYWVHQCPDLIHDAYQQFTLQRLGQEFDAGEGLAKRIAETMDEDGGCWSACSGCQDSVDGYVSTRDYPYSPIFKCQPGSGCRECGGIGVTWMDGAFLAGYGDALSEQPQSRVAAEPVGLREAEAIAGHAVARIDNFLAKFGGFEAYASLAENGTTTGWSQLRSTIWRAVKDAISATPSQPDPQSRGQAFDGEGMIEAVKRFIADVDDGDRAEAGNNPLMAAHIADLRAALSSAKRGEEG